MNKTLVIGFGNLYRRDDGAGAAVVNALRQCLGRQALAPDDDGLDGLGHDLDSVILHQLVPELAMTVAAYDICIFVDAHVGTVPEDYREERLEPCYRSATVSHQMHPCTVLALCQEMYGRAPDGYLFSLRGYDFDFGEGLSALTAALVPPAVERTFSLAGIESKGHPDA